MRRQFTATICIVLLTILSTSAAVPAQENLADYSLEELRAEIQVEHARWIHAFRSQDAEKAAALFDVDGALLGENGSITFGHKDILAAMKRWMAQIGPAQVEFSPSELWRIGNYAYESGKFTYQWGESNEDNKYHSRGTYLMIWKMQANGSWLIYRSIPLPE